MKRLSILALGLAVAACDFGTITGEGVEEEAVAASQSQLCSAKAAAQEPTPTVTQFKAVLRTPPAFPENCRGLDIGSYPVSMRFDIKKNGTTDNICISETVNNCFNTYAAEAVAAFVYEWAGEGSRPKAETGRGITLQFELEADDVEQTEE